MRTFIFPFNTAIAAKESADRSDQSLSALFIHSFKASDVRIVEASFNEFCQDTLMNFARVSVCQKFRAFKYSDQRLWYDHITHVEARINDFCETA